MSVVPFHRLLARQLSPLSGNVLIINKNLLAFGKTEKLCKRRAFSGTRQAEEDGVRLRCMLTVHSGPLHAEGAREAVARGVSEVHVLPLPSRGARLEAVLQAEHDPLLPRLSPALRLDGSLFGVRQEHPSVRNGDEGQVKRLPFRLLCLSHLQLQVLHRGQILSVRQQGPLSVRLRGKDDFSSGGLQQPKLYRNHEEHPTAGGFRWGRERFPYQQQLILFYSQPKYVSSRML
ncbi:hypothetical protein L596_003878 [Steinernema carpocapsae]|uniref:Uncharacterized protein n=1 Tax=Steinernema carpocapsae TaxID=34508 RepID=A0A4U8UU10_STECR|nr:hypothetical protein L596_003878 [Steinernema carpocapsae]